MFCNIKLIHIHVKSIDQCSLSCIEVSVFLMNFFLLCWFFVGRYPRSGWALYYRKNCACGFQIRAKINKACRTSVILTRYSTTAIFIVSEMFHVLRERLQRCYSTFVLARVLLLFSVQIISSCTRTLGITRHSVSVYSLGL